MPYISRIVLSEVVLKGGLLRVVLAQRVIRHHWRAEVEIIWESWNKAKAVASTSKTQIHFDERPISISLTVKWAVVTPADYLRWELNFLLLRYFYAWLAPYPPSFSDEPVQKWHGSLGGRLTFWWFGLTFYQLSGYILYQEVTSDFLFFLTSGCVTWIFGFSSIIYVTVRITLNFMQCVELSERWNTKKLCSHKITTNGANGKKMNIYGIVYFLWILDSKWLKWVNHLFVHPSNHPSSKFTFNSLKFRSTESPWQPNGVVTMKDNRDICLFALRISPVIRFHRAVHSLMNIHMWILATNIEIWQNITSCGDGITGLSDLGASEGWL